MKKLKSLFLILSVIAFSCSTSMTKRQFSIKDFIQSERMTSINIDSVRSNNSFLELFDTIPSEFGYIIFNEIIGSIPIESSDFKKLWNFEIDSIENVLAAKSNNIFDTDKSLSDDTYFLIVFFNTAENDSYAGTIYVDLKSEKIGTYYVERDSVSFAFTELSGDSVRIDNLKEKLKVRFSNE